MSEYTELIDDVACATCRQLVLEGPDEQRFVVVPADGGGWQAWGAALLRLIERVGHQPTQALIISQRDITDRYVQALIGHGLAHAEASSNVYLRGASRLTHDHEELLGLIGWQPPTSYEDDPDEMPANWSLPLVRGQWGTLTETLLATMIGVFGFSEHAPVQVRTFGCAHPCRTCSWPDES